MKLAWSLGIVSAVLLHAAVLAFGGVLFMDRDEAGGTVQAVELLSALEAEEEQPKEQPEETPEESAEELETEAEEPPDAAEIIRNLESASTDTTPALEAASLSALEAALNGQGVGGDFADVLSLAGGGKIGGTGIPGETAEKLEEAFSLAEIDQEPRVIYNKSPIYPAEMRGKKLEGVVSVIFIVDADGKVQSPRIERSSHSAFESPALSSIKKWKFEPGIRAGQRVATKTRISIRFPAK